jgi:ABC-type sulfate/molybdate transport systems ATPase subunit
MAEPDILLVDEVLAVGDAAFQMKCFERIELLRSSGTTVVVVSHNIGAIRRICDRSLVLHDATLRHDGTTEDAISLYYELLGTVGIDGDPIQKLPDESGDGPQFEAEALRFELVDAHGDPTRHFTTDESMEVVLDVTFNRAVKGVVAAINIHSDSGVRVYGETTEWQQAYDVGAGTTARLSVKLGALLAGGSYTATVNLGRLDDTAVMAPPRPILFFVHGRGLVKGVADLHATFAFDGADGAAIPTE